MASPTTLEEIGGQSGGPFSFTGKNNGASLQKIWVWVGETQVKAVEVWLSDGRSQKYGIPVGSQQEYIFQTGECFTALSLWANGDGSRLGAIKFKTNMGGSFFAKMKSELKKEIHIDVGSGYCLGIAGKSSSDIDRMGFMFLNAVQSTVLTNVNYPTVNQLIRDVAMEELKFMSFTNNSSANQPKMIESSKKVTEKSSWSMSTSFTATFSVDVKAGIPKVVEVSDGYSVTIGVGGTYRQDQIVDRNESFSTTIDVPPKKKIDVYITIGKAIFDLPYTGTVKITCKNGSVLQYDTQGRYNGVSYSDITVKMSESG